MAITGAGNGVFQHARLEATLSKSFAPEAVEGVARDAGEFNGDLHVSAAFRAQLIWPAAPRYCTATPMACSRCTTSRAWKTWRRPWRG